MVRSVSPKMGGTSNINFLLSEWQVYPVEYTEKKDTETPSDTQVKA